MKNELTAGHGFLQGVRFTQIAQGGLCFEVGDVVGTAARAHQQAQISALFSQPGTRINPLTCVPVPRPRQCRTQNPPVPHTLPTAMLRQALRVQENDSSLADPPKLAHFASAPNVSRYFFMNSRPSLRSS